MFDFAETVQRLREFAQSAGPDADGEAHRIEEELAVSCACFLYEHMTARNQLVGAAHLLAHALPLSIRDDARIRACVAHAVAATARLDSAAHELVKAREGTYSTPDALFAVRATLPWRVLYWLRAVRLAQASCAVEYGCGHGSNVLQCAQHDDAVQWSGVDVNAEQVECNRVQAKRIGIDAAFFVDPAPHLASLFDSVAVLHVLEHTAYPIQVLEAAERYVNARGHVVVVVPTDAKAVDVASRDLLDIRAGVCREERGHINSMDIGDLVALVEPRGRILDVAKIEVAPNNWDACVTYVPRRSAA